MSKKPIAIDLFSGCGGLTQGLKKAGFKVIAAIDNNSIAIKTYKMNHKNVRVIEKNIRNISPKKLKSLLKIGNRKIDLIAGCPPCQGFSRVRTRNGTRRNYDKRNGLIFDVLRFVKVFKPKAIMIENVPGLAKTRAFVKFRRILSRLDYKIEYAVKDSAKYGVPQRRKRLIMLAGLKREIPFAKESRVRITVRKAIGGLKRAGKSGDPIHDLAEKHSEKVMKLIRDIPKDGGSRLDLPKSRQLECHKNINGFKDIYGRMAWNKVSPTITGGCFNPSKGRFLHPSANRAITIREASILQSFPRKYVFPADESKQALALMVGNALPPEFIRRHANEIRKAIIGK